jgi:hypothetical protein
MDVGERSLLLDTVRRAIAETSLDRDGAAAVDAVLARLGWLDLLAAEPQPAVEIVFAALGTSNATATALDDVFVSALGWKPRPGLAVLLPRYAAWEPPGRIDAGDLDALGLATARATTADELLVVCGAETDRCGVTVPIAGAELGAVHGVDPAAGLRAVHVRSAAPVARRCDAAAWESAVAFGRRAVAHQIGGACRAMLDLACAHARERVQFGRPIGRFQAVRHRLAEALVAVEGLEASLLAAAEDATPDTAALAKAVAGRAAQTVAAHCQQVLAGIGFTTDHRFHRFLKRTMLLEGLFGSADEIVAALGRRLLASRTVPTLIELRGATGIPADRRRPVP